MPHQALELGALWAEMRADTTSAGAGPGPLTIESPRPRFLGDDLAADPGECAGGVADEHHDGAGNDEDEAPCGIKQGFAEQVKEDGSD